MYTLFTRFCPPMEILGCNLINLYLFGETWGIVEEMDSEKRRRLEKVEKWQIEARTAFDRGRLGIGRILERKPFLVGFRLKFDGGADVVIVRMSKKYLLHKMHSRLA